MRVKWIASSDSVRTRRLFDNLPDSAALQSPHPATEVTASAEENEGANTEQRSAPQRASGDAGERHDLERLLACLTSRWPLVILCCMIGGAIGYLHARDQPVRYSSTATLIALQPGDGIVSSQTVASYAELVNSPVVVNQVAAESPSVAKRQLRSEVSATVRTNTNLIAVTVTAARPAAAAHQANRFATSLVGAVDHLLRTSSVGAEPVGAKVASTALVPTSTTAPSTLSQVVIGVGAGAVIGLLLATLIPQGPWRRRRGTVAQQAQTISH